MHSHWTVDDKKMSKSKNNVVDPNIVATKYTYEGLRYFLLREGVSHSDGSKFIQFFAVVCSVTNRIIVFLIFFSQITVKSRLHEL